MSTRTIIEINHDYLQDLHDKGHIGLALFMTLCSSGNMDTMNADRKKPQGIRALGQRHHSETLKLVVR